MMGDFMFIQIGTLCETLVAKLMVTLERFLTSMSAFMIYDISFLSKLLKASFMSTFKLLWSIIVDVLMLI